MIATPIPTFVINLRKRTDRKAHVLSCFQDRKEFDLNIVEAHENEIGTLGLWSTLCFILENLVATDSEYVIVCEDDVSFTPDYEPEQLLRSISEAIDLNADVLLGGVSWFASVLQVSERLFWTECFNGLQFTIFFRKFFNKILAAPKDIKQGADYRISGLSSHIFLIYPFPAVQREFGYSDATKMNNEPGRITALFENTTERINVLNRVKRQYNGLQLHGHYAARIPYDQVTVPTYVINLPGEEYRREHIFRQFAGRPEFDLHIFSAPAGYKGTYALWLSVREIVKISLVQDADVVIICTDVHEFTADYSNAYLFQNIIEAHEQGANYLSGSAAKFGHAIPLTENRYWVNYCLAADFIVIYRKFFQAILDEPFDENVLTDTQLSDLTSNKMILFPFISVPGNLQISIEKKMLVAGMFEASAARLAKIQQAYLRYGNWSYTESTIEK
jgi:GR25 family glycosyltransferase involved in LPS biosynthesis